MIVGIVFAFIGLDRYLKHITKMKELELACLKKQKDRGENNDLEKELLALKERVNVLEKIVTDRKYQLDEEIRSLKK
ncbi:nitrite reductase [Photobacterium lipolyticum]|uniref:Nitrite reductase n=1 Tax=Photobacterium lipolyticum TaxID=266810 RepID=A0A2T3N416_9GAMM|nr:nitrite reductase [Photobacterium lipolyticum]PSW07206.1 nitrite reductase [Photobacterium lipolyticum]